MAIIKTNNSDVKSIVSIYDRERSNYQRDFETVRAERSKGRKEDKTFAKEILSFSPVIALGATIVLLSVAGDVGWMDKSLSVNLAFMMFGLLFFSVIGLIAHADNSYKKFESGHYSNYKSKVSKQELSIIDALHDRFSMTSHQLQYQKMEDGEYAIRFMDIKSLRNKVVNTAFIVDN